MTITMTPVLEILATVLSSCDFGSVNGYPGKDIDEKRTNFWIECIESKASDTGFGHLVESILEHGFDKTSAVGWDGDGYITEGHHRLVAAILLCLDEIPTSGWGREGKFVKKPVEGMEYGYFSAHTCSDEYPIYVEFFE